MPGIGKVFRRPPTVPTRDRIGAFRGISDGVAPVLRCKASPHQVLLAENPGKASLWVNITEPWYKMETIEKGEIDKFIRHRWLFMRCRALRLRRSAADDGYMPLPRLSAQFG